MGGPPSYTSVYAIFPSFHWLKQVVGPSPESPSCPPRLGGAQQHSLESTQLPPFQQLSPRAQCRGSRHSAPLAPPTPRQPVLHSHSCCQRARFPTRAHRVSGGGAGHPLGTREARDTSPTLPSTHTWLPASSQKEPPASYLPVSCGLYPVPGLKEGAERRGESCVGEVGRGWDPMTQGPVSQLGAPSSLPAPSWALPTPHTHKPSSVKLPAPLPAA